VVQDPQTAEAAAMPRAAIELARPQRILPPGAIEQLLLGLNSKGAA
jgi:chemotaxis response regulator CheB